MIFSNKDHIVFREEARPSDRRSVQDIVASTGFFSASEILVAVELLEERLSRGIACGYHFLFAEHAGKVLGYSCFGPIACTRSSWDLYWIAIRGDIRRGGLGRQLLARSESCIGRQGGARIYVETSSRDLYLPTRSFYHGCGYREEAVLEDFYSTGDHKVIFVKVIT
jgi:GNAT superfamily N-acetyltransferase